MLAPGTHPGPGGRSVPCCKAHRGHRTWASRQDPRAPHPAPLAPFLARTPGGDRRCRRPGGGGGWGTRGLQRGPPLPLQHPRDPQSPCRERQAEGAAGGAPSRAVPPSFSAHSSDLPKLHVLSPTFFSPSPQLCALR